jgi:formylglycine-generating enzyme required for sulfatase activity
MVIIPAGSFRMGSLQEGGEDDEKPVRTVTFTQPFAMGRYEVTFDEYDRFARASGRKLPDDNGWGRGRNPVINVSWKDAMAYAHWLSKQTGQHYRLPTEAEWEYAARAGSESKYNWGNEIETNRANCNGCRSRWDGKQSAPVGSFQPNQFALYDTLGNVWEWVEDCWRPNYDGEPANISPWVKVGGGNCSRRMRRGGSWGDEPIYVRSANRGRGTPDYRNLNLGFRLARDLG